MERTEPRVIDAKFRIVREKRPPIWQRYEIYYDWRAGLIGVLAGLAYLLRNPS